MNGELEKNFFEEIKPLIDEYIEYTNAELPDYTAITRQNENKVYSNDEEGKIEQSLDEEINKLIASKMEELRQLKEKNKQERQETIYSKAQEFVTTTKEEMDKQIEEKNKKLKEKEKELDANKRETEDLGGKLKKLKMAKEDLKDVDENVYKAINDAEQEKMNTLKDARKAYNRILEEHKNMQEEVQQLKEQRDGFEKTYSGIDFKSEKGISDIVGIIESRREKEEPIIEEEEEISDDNSNAFGTSENDARITSLKDLEEKDKEEEEKNDNTKFPRVNPDEVDVLEPNKVLTVDDLKDGEEQDNDEIAYEDVKRKQEEEKMWEEYNKEQQEKREQDENEAKDILEKREQEIKKEKEKEAKRIEKIDEERNKNKEEEEKRLEEEQRKRKLREKFFKDKEKGYEDLLKEDNAYQALKEILITRYKLYQLKTTLGDKSLIDIYTLYVKQIEKNIKDSFKTEKNLTGEELDKAIMERLDNQDLLETLKERLEKLKERERELRGTQPQSQPQPQPQSQPQPQPEPAYVQEVREKLENLYAKAEEGYEDLLPSLYYDRKKEEIEVIMTYIMTGMIEFDQSAYENMSENINIDRVVALCRDVDDYIKDWDGSYPKENGELATDEEIRELRNGIYQIEKRKNIKENAYKETKIVVEPYNDRIMVYLKGEVEPKPFDHLAQLMEDGEVLAKSEHLQTGLLRGVQIGDLAVLHVLQELEITTGQKLVDGYTWMYAKPNNIEKDKHPSPIDEIVYDFSNENKIQDKKMIKTMQKYAKTAEGNGVAKSIGRKKSIAEKAKDGITGLLGIGKETVLALGEGIKSKNPIERAKKKINNKKYYTPKEVDGSKATSTYNEWRADMDAKEEVWRKKMGENAPTLEEQANFMQVFKDRSEQETESEKNYAKRQNEFYDMYGN